MPGENNIVVRARDGAGNLSRDATRSLVYVATSPLSVEVVGEGTVSPNLDGQSLELGRSYKMKAAPSRGHLFAGWTGDVSSTEPKLTFVMQSNLVMAANFIPNPFIPVEGLFNGLFYETNSIQFAESGFFVLKLTDRGTYSARLLLGGKRHSASGVFNLDGHATNSIVRRGTNTLTVEWHLDLASDMEQIRGYVGDGQWLAELHGDRASASAGTFQGQYTLAIPGQAESTSSPGGDGFGTVSIDSRGNLKLSESLADGTSIRQRVHVSKDGVWPLFVSFSGGKGSVLGWVIFGDDGNNDLAGLVVWFKTPNARSKYYADGFETESLVIGSRYLAPSNGERVLNFTDGQLILSRAGVSNINSFTLQSNNKILATDPKRVKLSVKTSKGLFKGSVVVEGQRKRLAIKGSVLQRQNLGTGYFLTPDQSGQVTLEATP